MNSRFRISNWFSEIFFRGIFLAFFHNFQGSPPQNSSSNSRWFVNICLYNLLETFWYQKTKRINVLANPWEKFADKHKLFLWKVWKNPDFVMMSSTAIFTMKYETKINLKALSPFLFFLSWYIIILCKYYIMNIV